MSRESSTAADFDPGITRGESADSDGAGVELSSSTEIGATRADFELGNRKSDPPERNKMYPPTSTIEQMTTNDLVSGDFSGGGAERLSIAMATSWLTVLRWRRLSGSLDFSRGSEWERSDSNREPRDYESPALTVELRAL